MGHLNNAIDALLEIEAHSGTFNSTTGVSISLSKTVDAISEYSVTDHSATGASGSLADVLNAMRGTSGIIEFPGNRTYTLTARSITIPAGVALFFQPGAKIDIGYGLTLTITDSSAIVADTGQQIFDGDGDVRFTHGGAVWGNWFGMVGDDSTDSTDAWDIRMQPVDGILPVTGHG